MILLSLDAVFDIERLRSFLAAKCPGSTRRALSAIGMAISLREQGIVEKDAEFMEKGVETYVSKREEAA